VPVFALGDLRLHYAERGDPGGPAVVLVHGLLWSARMFERLCVSLPTHRMLLLDLHGHGKSSAPTDPARYTWASLTDDVVGLLDHLAIGRAIVGGLSLGANVTLAVAHRHPARVRAMGVEMPVLSGGHPVARPLFGALAGVYRAGGVALRPVAGAVGRLPVPLARRLPDIAAARDVVAANPRVAAAVLRGLLADEPVDESDAALRRLTMPALVIGHRNDPLHPLADARRLASLLPDARLVEVPSIAHFRLHPALLADELRRFVDGLPADGVR
jgi:pimeloyl-ACP methyl ester carboxylesterase